MRRFDPGPRLQFLPPETKRQFAFVDGVLTATYYNNTLQGGTPTSPVPWLSYDFVDWLGTKRVQINDSAQVEMYWASDAYGNYLTATGAGMDATEHHFTSQEVDWESGNGGPTFTGTPQTHNSYFNARYYGPTLGRFLTPDPSGQYFANPENPQTWNFYAYVANDPVINVDPFGLWIWSFGICYYDTVAVYVTSGGSTDFQGYDTQSLGCFTPPPPPPQQPQQPQKPQQQPPQIDCSTPPPMPPTPKNASIVANEQATKKHSMAWWLMQVRPGGDWDYKKDGHQQYASFGNVNYGATCDAGLGKDLTFCQRGAGAAAYGTATANVAEGGRWTAGPGSPTGAPANDNGMPDYGDQASGTENQSVIAGFGYAQWQKACGKLQ
jgi:RHS repeat-associated protein